jgi:hypothetical protein
MARLVPKSRTPCKKWWRDSQNPIHKKKKKTLVSLLERYLVLEIAMLRGDISKRPSAHL